MLCIGNTNIALDRKESGSDLDFISHAHSDHTAALRASRCVLASSETMQLLGQEGKSYVTLKAGESSTFGLLDSGHMLGAKQLCVDDSTAGKRTVYTGDFKMQESRTTKRIEIASADTVIVDATYPEPWLRFEDRLEIESCLQDWTANKLRHGIVLFSAYAMGKSQELISILNEAGITPVVSRRISAASRVYRNCGVNIAYASAYDEGSDCDSIMKGNFVGITDSRDVRALGHSIGEVHGKRVFTAVATGFAKKFRFDTDAQFALSDHADFKQCVDYIDATGAKSVFTYGHSAAALAENLKKEGYAALPMPTYAERAAVTL
jgi:putative mRNA 3-end processing factor